MKQKLQILTYIFFIVSKILIVLNPGIFWDDWTLYKMDTIGIMSQFIGNGAIYFGYLHKFLQNSPYPVFIYHSLTFLFQFLTIFFLFKIIKKWPFPERNITGVYFFVLIYAILPVNDAAITMICFPYTVSLFLFILATFLLIGSKQKGGVFYRLCSLILFFMSFTTSSLVFFYILPFTLIIFQEEVKYMNSHPIRKWSSIIITCASKLLRHIDFLILPIIFWYVKSIYFSPSNHYKDLNYNRIDLDSFLLMPISFIKFVYIFFASLKPFLLNFVIEFEFFFTFILVSFIVYKLLKFKYLDFKFGKKMVIIGVSLICIGAFPYLLVEKFPSFSSYNSRHMLLLGFGISVLIVSGISQISSFTFKKIITSMIIGGALIFNIYLQFNYFKGYIKQSILTNIFTSIDTEMNSSSTILFKDATLKFTTKGNPRNFYELTGILKKTNSKENTLIIRKEDFEKYNENGTFKILSPFFYQYNLSNYRISEPNKILTLKFSAKDRPVIPIYSYYRDYFFGQTEQWNKYFEYELSDYSG